ncbi:hypothetical protein ABVK25_009965 [Lepraria finkii]|uniref:Uncharacterized protein n=1 Tax=Lepraria finkii TaxID=1340010 RepID=A0ABR4AXT8_9LECA
MAPSRVSKPRHTAAKALAKHQVTDDDDASQQGYQSAGDDNIVVKMAEKIRIDAKARLQNRRASINKSHEETLKKIEDDTNTAFDEISRRAKQRHKQRMERLYDILRRKSEIETRMIASAKRIDEAYEMAEKALGSALEHRLHDLREP